MVEAVSQWLPSDAFDGVTRFEVIDHTAENRDKIINHGGAATVYRQLGVGVELSLQDGGRTLKVFLRDSPVPAESVLAQMASGWRPG